jgi:hypothetical protein
MVRDPHRASAERDGRLRRSDGRRAGPAAVRRAAPEQRAPESVPARRVEAARTSARCIRRPNPRTVLGRPPVWELLSRARACRRAWCGSTSRIRRRGRPKSWSRTTRGRDIWRPRERDGRDRPDRRRRSSRPARDAVLGPRAVRRRGLRAHPDAGESAADHARSNSSSTRSDPRTTSTSAPSRRPSPPCVRGPTCGFSASTSRVRQHLPRNVAVSVPGAVRCRPAAPSRRRGVPRRDRPLPRVPGRVRRAPRHSRSTATPNVGRGVRPRHGASLDGLDQPIWRGWHGKIGIFVAQGPKRARVTGAAALSYSRRRADDHGPPRLRRAERHARRIGPERPWRRDFRLAKASSAS